MLKITRKIKNLFNNENAFDPESYQKTLESFHKENKAFNEKVISTFSISAIPLLIGLSDKLDLSNNIIFVFLLVSLLLFLTVFIAQIISNTLAIKACDHGLRKDYEKSNSYFEKTDCFENWILGIFFIAIIISLGMFITNISIKRENSQQITKKETIIMAEQKNFIKYVKDSGTPSKNVRPNPVPAPKSNQDSKVQKNK